MSDDVLRGFIDDETSDVVRHPVVVFFHLVFRLLALLTYLFCGFFSSSFIAPFVFIVLLLSADFWTVKNVSGRLLVGLRWWNYIDEDGKSQWVYEARKGTSPQGVINAYERRLFWVSLVLCPLLWVVFFVATLFSMKFKWFMVVCIALVLNGANLWGYVKCKLGKSEIKSTISKYAQSYFQRQIITNLFRRQAPTTSGGPSQTI